MSGGRITYLLEQLTAGLINPSEKEELDRLILDTGLKGSFTRVLEEMLEANKTGPAWKGEQLEKMVEGILSVDRTGNPVNRRPARIYSMRRWWAAAAIALIAGTYFLVHHENEKQISKANKSQYKNDVAPGGSKAILTLGNGRQIILDSAQNGKLANQGNTTITKTDSGKLTYNILNEKPVEVSYNVLATPKGGQFQLTLPDGSQVWLNAASSIRYPTAFVGKERTVEITGEAYFEIAHNDKQPFKVKANDEVIEDLGTHFNVNAYADEPNTKTTLLEGSVKVNGHILRPGQQAQGNVLEIKIVDGADLEQAVAWKNGLFKFKGANIKEIMRQIERWYDVDVEFSGNVDSLDFGGIVSRKAYVSELLKLLETTGTIHFKVDGKKIIVSP